MPTGFLQVVTSLVFGDKNWLKKYGVSDWLEMIRGVSLLTTAGYSQVTEQLSSSSDRDRFIMEDTDFYTIGKSYWENVPATIDGMLGGYSNVLKADVQASSRFLSSFLNDKIKPLNCDKALDCGSGIGRVTKHLLLKYFKSVDMVEQNKEFLDASHKYLEDDDNKVAQRFNCGLQDFVPTDNHYDVIWCQWVTGYLTDDDFVSFLVRCKKGLKKDGIIFVKDNLCQEETDFDNKDGSVTRPNHLLLNLFKKANLEVLAERKQYKFPKGLCEVKMFALR